MKIYLWFYNSVLIKAWDVIRVLLCSHYGDFSNEINFITEKVETYINKENISSDKVKVDIIMKNENDYINELKTIDTGKYHYDIYMVEDRYVNDFLQYIGNLDGAILRSDVELNPIIEKKFIEDCMKYSNVYKKTILKCMVLLYI